MNTTLVTLGVGTVLAMILLTTVEYFVPQAAELFGTEIADGVTIKVGMLYVLSNIWAYFRPPAD